MGVGTRQPDFAEFYRSAADECLRAVLVSIGDQDTARELVDEAFARAWRPGAPRAGIPRRKPGWCARRRIPAVAGALAVAAATALAVTTLLPSSHPELLSSGHPGRHPVGVRLAAWTVTKQANGDIDVTINQLKDPAGLQATLRAAGLPVNVTFSGSLEPSASCQPYQTATLNTLSAVAQIRGNSLVIDPSALPPGTGLAIFDEPGAGLPVLSGTTPTLGKPPAHHPSIPPLLTALNGPLAIGMVYASQQCTG
jgi:hypothetical protein